MFQQKYLHAHQSQCLEDLYTTLHILQLPLKQIFIQLDSNWSGLQVQTCPGVEQRLVEITASCFLCFTMLPCRRHLNPPLEHTFIKSFSVITREGGKQSCEWNKQRKKKILFQMNELQHDLRPAGHENVIHNMTEITKILNPFQ